VSGELDLDTFRSSLYEVTIDEISNFPFLNKAIHRTNIDTQTIYRSHYIMCFLHSRYLRCGYLSH